MERFAGESSSAITLMVSKNFRRLIVAGRGVMKYSDGGMYIGEWRDERQVGK